MDELLNDAGLANRGAFCVVKVVDRVPSRGESRGMTAPDGGIGPTTE